MKMRLNGSTFRLAMAVFVVLDIMLLFWLLNPVSRRNDSFPMVDTTPVVDQSAAIVANDDKPSALGTIADVARAKRERTAFLIASAD